MARVVLGTGVGVGLVYDVVVLEDWFVLGTGVGVG